MYTTMLCLGALTFVALGGPTSELRAQTTGTAPAIAIDDRVRVTAPSYLEPARGTARVTGFQNDTLTMVMDKSGESISLPFSHITKLEVSRGRHGSLGHGLLNGAVLGGVLGAVFGATAGSAPCQSPCVNITGGAGALVGGVFGILFGGLVGGGIGALHKSEHFERVSSLSSAALIGAAREHLVVAPGSGMKSVAIGLHF